MFLPVWQVADELGIDLIASRRDVLYFYIALLVGQCEIGNDSVAGMR